MDFKAREEEMRIGGKRFGKLRKEEVEEGTEAERVAWSVGLFVVCVLCLLS